MKHLLSFKTTEICTCSFDSEYTLRCTMQHGLRADKHVLFILIDQKVEKHNFEPMAPWTSSGQVRETGTTSILSKNSNPSEWTDSAEVILKKTLLLKTFCSFTMNSGRFAIRVSKCFFGGPKHAGRANSSSCSYVPVGVQDELLGPFVPTKCQSQLVPSQAGPSEAPPPAGRSGSMWK